MCWAAKLDFVPPPSKKKKRREKNAYNFSCFLFLFWSVARALWQRSAYSTSTRFRPSNQYQWVIQVYLATTGESHDYCSEIMKPSSWILVTWHLTSVSLVCLKNVRKWIQMIWVRSPWEECSTRERRAQLHNNTLRLFLLLWVSRTSAEFDHQTCPMINLCWLTWNSTTGLSLLLCTETNSTCEDSTASLFCLRKVVLILTIFTKKKSMKMGLCSIFCDFPVIRRAWLLCAGCHYCHDKYGCRVQVVMTLMISMAVVCRLLSMTWHFFWSLDHEDRKSERSTPRHHPATTHGTCYR